MEIFPELEPILDAIPSLRFFRLGPFDFVRPDFDLGGHLEIMANQYPTVHIELTHEVNTKPRDWTSERYEMQAQGVQFEDYEKNIIAERSLGRRHKSFSGRLTHGTRGWSIFWICLFPHSHC